MRYFLGHLRRSGWTRPFIFRRLSPVGTCESGRLTLFATIEPSHERRKIISRPGCSLRSKRFQSSYCAKDRAEAKKKKG